MKTNALVLAALFALSTATGKERRVLPEVTEVVSVLDLTTEKTMELAKGMHSDVAIFCEEGTTLPLQFLNRFKAFSLKWVPDLTLTVEKTCYFRYVGKKSYMSYDLVNWEKPSLPHNPRHQSRSQSGQIPYIGGEPVAREALDLLSR